MESDVSGSSEKGGGSLFSWSLGPGCRGGGGGHLLVVVIYGLGLG